MKQLGLDLQAGVPLKGSNKEVSLVHLNFRRTALLALWIRCVVEREFFRKPKTRCSTVWVRDGKEPGL